MNGLMGAAPHFPNTPMMPSGAPSLAGSFRMPPPEGPATAPAPGPGSANQVSGEGEQDVLSTAQRSMLKWEKEEVLGELATVAPVLYSNTNFPQLREQYPGTHTLTHYNTHTNTHTTETIDQKCVCVCVRLVHQSEADR